MAISNKKQCLKCLKEKVASTQFYKSNSDNHADGRFPICRECLKGRLKLENPLSDEAIQSVKDILLEMNRPFIYSQYLASVEEYGNGNEMFGKYIKNIQLNFKNYTWKDSDFNKTEENNDQIKNEEKEIKNEFKVTEDLIDKWGAGYTADEYHNFERKYEKLIKNYGEKTALHTEGLISYIRFRVKEEMATARGDVKEAKEWGALASKQAQDAKINVSQLSKSDISGGVDVLSQLFEAVETEVGVIPLLPKVLAQPYDDADLIIWSIINYYRRLEDKNKVSYKDIYGFYDEMLEEHFKAQGFNKKQINEFKAKRNNVFRDLEGIYKEPLYETGDE